jgi:hypothetical protein
MKITIHDKKKIHEIQKEFCIVFPNLKLEFFDEPHGTKKASHKRLLLDSTKSIAESRRVHSKGEMVIVPHMTVSEVKHAFGEPFGLSVEVYRKVGDTWLEPTIDHWTLEKHNASASELNAENTLERI